jgi:hypothetical protein
MGPGIGMARGERASVILYGAEAMPERSERVVDALADVLRREQYELVDVFAEARRVLEDGAPPDSDLAVFARAEQLMQEGWRSYLEVRPGFAAARLAEARTLVLSVAHQRGGNAALAEISLRLGVVKLDLAQAAEAADDFRLCYALAPERVVADSEFKPEVVVAFEAAIAEARASQRRPLTLQPAGAKLWVDGRGLSGEIHELFLEDGLHLLSARKAGFVSQAQLISVSPGVDAPVRMQLDVDPVAAKVLEGRSAMARGVPEAAARTAAGAFMFYAATDDLILLASVWRRGLPALLGQRCRGQPVQCSRVVEIGYPEGGLLVAAAELWRSLPQAGTRFPPSLQNDPRLLASEAPLVGGEVAKRPFWANRWLWAGVAAASLAGGAMYLLAGDDARKPIFVGDGCGFGGC